eukprot:gene6990-34260_t
MSEEQKDQMKWAVKNGDMGMTEIVKHLVETAGVDVNTKDDNGMDALIAAVYELHTETVEYLIGAGATGHKDSKAPDGSSYQEAAKTVDAPQALVDLL